MKKIYYGLHSIDKKDISAVINVLKNKKLTQGDQVIKFEDKLKTKFKAKYCTSVTNGSSALFSVMKCLGLSKKDIVVTTPMSFVGTANCIELVGATTKFIDIDKRSYNLDVNKLENFLKKTKKKISAVISVDYAGHPNDWLGLRKLANKYNFKLINDCCHSIGSKISNDIGYASKFADFVTYSFHPVKAITTGEGGAILTNSHFYKKKLDLIRNNFMEKKPEKFPWFYKIESPGFNFRLSDINCALGVSQLSKLSIFIKKRREIANLYNRIFEKDKRFIIPSEKKNSFHSYHLYPLLVDFKKFNLSKKNFFLKLMKKNIFLQVHYIPIHLQPYYKKRYNIKKNELINAENFYAKEISLPIYPSLSIESAKFVAKSIININ